MVKNNEDAAGFFSTSDYRRLVRQGIEQRKIFQKDFTFDYCARSARIAKSYLSRVLAGKADLSTDQLWLISDALDWNADEREYALLCLEWSRASVAERKKALAARIKAIQEKFSQTHHSLEKINVVGQNATNLTWYYLEPLIQVIHVGLTIPKFARQPSLLQDALGIGSDRLNKSLRTLVENGFIELTNKGYRTVTDGLHLSGESDLYAPWRNLMLQFLHSVLSWKAIQKTDISFNALFTATDAERESIHQDFLKLLNRARHLSEKASPSNLYQLNFTLVCHARSADD